VRGQKLKLAVRALSKQRNSAQRVDFGVGQGAQDNSL
jgi:hypothetical protein